MNRSADKMAKEKTFIETYKSVKSDKKKLKLLLRKAEGDEIKTAILDNIDNKDVGLIIWQDVLGNVKDESKLFGVVKEVRIR